MEARDQHASVGDQNSTRPQWRVHIAQPIDEAAVRLLEENAHVTLGWGTRAVDLESVLPDVDGLLVRTVPITDDVLRKAPRLRVLARMGAGYDNVDVEAATRHGVPVIFTPGINATTVAEHVMGMVVAAYRGIVQWDADVRAGRFTERDSRLGRDVAGKVMGIIGVGRIGSEVARIATKGFGMRVQGYHPRRDDAELLQLYVSPTSSLDELLSTSDVVSVHLPRSSETEKTISARELDLMRDDAVLIDVSRGGIVDQDALVATLQSGRLLAAAIDVYEKEPPDRDNPLFSCERAILTPHTASHTTDAFAALGWAAATQLLDGLDGREPKSLANPEAWATTDASARAT